MPGKKSKAYFVGAGIGSLAAAAFLIRDGELDGDDIRIFEAAARVGGSLDGSGDAHSGYTMRGGRMFTTDNYECTWDLFKSIPSLSDATLSVYAETLAFNERCRTHSTARLMDRRRARVPVDSMDFSTSDRLDLLKLASAHESSLGDSRITDWLSPHFFETNFWYLWSSAFAFLPWHGAVEFRRYLHRFILEFSWIETVGGVKRTVYNQYDSLVRPLQAWLEQHGVRFQTRCRVSEVEHRNAVGRFVVTGLRCETGGSTTRHEVGEDDWVFIQNGSMTEDSNLGSMTAAPVKFSETRGQGWKLWEQLAEGRPEFGNPRAFNRTPAQSCWESFTVTLRTTAFFDLMMALTGGEPGTGGPMTFRDSNWLLSIVLAQQPHFIDQPGDVHVFWGFGLYPDRIGNFVAKPMDECNGAELLQELCGHLRFEPDTVAGATCIPCRMPYISSMFLPRAAGDRPPPVPLSSKNLAFIGQFVELPEDVVFTVEYSIRAAQTAVYSLLDIRRPIPPVTPQLRPFQFRLDALLKAFDLGNG